MPKNVKSVTGKDAFIGQRLRAARLAAHVSQEALGDVLGITFQQIQKYENGKNRIAVTRLAEIARFLKIDLSYFVPDQPAAGESQMIMTKMLADRDGQKCAAAFFAIKDREVRKAAVRLLEQIAATRNR